MQTVRDARPVALDQLEELAVARAACTAAELHLQSVVERCITSGLSYDQIAPMLGMTPAAAWERFSSPIRVGR